VSCQNVGVVGEIFAWLIKDQELKQIIKENTLEGFEGGYVRPRPGKRFSYGRRTVEETE
jgi:hypothetical protein